MTDTSLTASGFYDLPKGGGNWCNGNTLARVLRFDSALLLTSVTHEEKLYSYHVANHRRIVESLNALESQLRSAIATGNGELERALLPLYILLIGASAEARLQKLLLEPKAFTQDHITFILGHDTQYDKWRTLIQVALHKHAKSPDFKVAVTDRVGRINLLLYRDVLGLVDRDLRAIIELRNKMAHGQWEFPLVNWRAPHLLSDLKRSSEHTRSLKAENFLTMLLKRGMIDRLLDIVRDLALSKAAFQRDYDAHWKRIQNASVNVSQRSFRKYRDNLVARHARGLAKRWRMKDSDDFII